MSIYLEKKSIVKYNTDVIVNAANAQLLPGSGVCGAIFKAAGYNELKDECVKIGYCETGNAVITKGYNLCNYIIHAVGPIWRGGNNNEEKLLYSAYYSSLNICKENNLKSICFPLISSGIYGYPLKEAWEVAIKACKDFLEIYDIDIYFAIIDDDLLKLGEEIFHSLNNKE